MNEKVCDYFIYNDWDVQKLSSVLPWHMIAVMMLWTLLYGDCLMLVFLLLRVPMKVISGMRNHGLGGGILYGNLSFRIE